MFPCLCTVKIEPTNMKKALVSEKLFNRHESNKYSFFRAFDVLLLLAFSYFLVYCLTPSSHVSVQNNAIAKPSFSKLSKS